MNGMKWLGLLMIPVLAAGIALREGFSSEPKQAAGSESPVQDEGRDRAHPPLSQQGDEAWDGLVGGWKRNDDEAFQKAYDWILAQGPGYLSELRKRMHSPGSSHETRLFASELLLRLDRKASRAEVMDAMLKICSTREGRTWLARMIRTEEGEVRVYDIARNAIRESEMRDQLPALLKALHSGDVETRLEVLEQLSRLEPDPDWIRIPVSRCLEDDHAEVRGAALAFVPVLHPEEAPEYFSNVLETESDSQIVFHAGRLMSGVATLEDLPRIGQLLERADRPATQLAAAQVASSMNPQPPVAWLEKEVLPGVWSLLDSKTAPQEHRAGAAAVLNKLVTTHGSKIDPEIGTHIAVMLESEKDPWVHSLLSKAGQALP